MEMNLQPFYVGQKVIAVNACEGSAIKNGQTYTVYDCHYSESCNPISPPGKKYWYVGVTGHHNWLRPSIFAPLDEFKAVTFEEMAKLNPISAQ